MTSIMYFNSFLLDFIPSQHYFNHLAVASAFLEKETFLSLISGRRLLLEKREFVFLLQAKNYTLVKLRVKGEFNGRFSCVKLPCTRIFTLVVAAS